MENLKFEDLPKATSMILEKLTLIENEIVSLKANLQPKQSERLMTRTETADYFQISLSTLWHWTKKGMLNSYGIGNKVYYKLNEIEKRIVMLC
tara:strand:+ start:2001 stop:2279 length:279 start_codon:yes stop_codon:yes gene_type:complete